MELKHMLNDDPSNDRPLKRQSTSPPLESRHSSGRDSSQDIPALHLVPSKFAGSYTYFTSKNSSDSEPEHDTATPTAMDIVTSPYFMTGAQPDSATLTPAEDADFAAYDAVDYSSLFIEQPDSDPPSPLKAPSPPTQYNLRDTPTPTIMDLTTARPPPSPEPLDLTHMDPSQRQEHYQHLFEDIHIPLKEYIPPSLCTQNPDFAAEILTAYFEHVTFSVKIWVNYDGLTRYFYNNPKRKKDCGKLDMSPRERARLKNIGLEDIAFHNIILKIGTPFRPFATLFLTTLRDTETKTYKLHVQGIVANESAQTHKRLMKLCSQAATGLKSEEFHTRTKQGIFMSHLEDIACFFCREPLENDGGGDLDQNFED